MHEAIDRIEEIVRTIGIMGDLDREGVTHCIKRIKQLIKENYIKMPSVEKIARLFVTSGLCNRKDPTIDKFYLNIIKELGGN